MMEGLQVVKRAIANEVFKFVTTLDKINFVESYSKAKPQEKPAEKKVEAAPAQPKAA